MSFNFHNLKSLGNRISISIPSDEDGLTGRECPQPNCLGYFKIKFGTGLSGENLPCFCPYCGYEGNHNQFWTQDQIKYAKSVGLKKISEAFRADLRKLEFKHKPSGFLGIGINVKFTPGSSIPLHRYQEKLLQTSVVCNKCTLQYAVYGVFAFCPDCASHNSLQILEANLSLIRKQLNLAKELSDFDLQRHLIEDALENCISSFDSFGREMCKVHSGKSSNPKKCLTISFQNLNNADDSLKKLFGISLKSAISPSDFQIVEVFFMKRHLLAHKAGVIDQKYLDDTGESKNMLGRKITVTPNEINLLANHLFVLGKHLVSNLSLP